MKEVTLQSQPRMRQPVTGCSDPLCEVSDLTTVSMPKHSSAAAIPLVEERTLILKDPAERVFRDLKASALVPKLLAPLLASVQSYTTGAGNVRKIERELQRKAISSVTPFGLLACLVANDRVDLECLLAEQRRWLQRGCDNELSAVNIEKGIWGVGKKEIEDLGLAYAFTAGAWPDEVELTRVIRDYGESKCEALLTKLLASLPSRYSAHMIFMSCAASDLSASDFAKQAGIKKNRVAGVLREKEALPFARFKHILSLGDIKCTTLDQARWWIDCSELSPPSGGPLGDRLRVAHTLLLSKDGRFASICPEVSAKRNVRSGQDALRRLAKGLYNKDSLARLYSVTGTDPKSPRGVYLEAVFKDGSIQQAVARVLQGAESNSRQDSWGDLKRGARALIDFHEADALFKTQVAEPRLTLDTLLSLAHFRFLAARGGGVFARRQQQMLAFCEACPGATPQEVLSALQPEHAPISQKKDLSRLVVSMSDETKWNRYLVSIGQKRMNELCREGWRIDDATRCLYKGEHEIKLGDVEEALHGTTTVPGTRQRMRVYENRLILDLSLWHRGDDNRRR